MAEWWKMGVEVSGKAKRRKRRDGKGGLFVGEMEKREMRVGWCGLRGWRWRKGLEGEV